MAEHGLVGPVIGIAFDGSGFGTDGTVWGGEFLIARYDGFERAACLEPMPLPGGEVSIRRPYRLAFAYLHALGLETAGLPSIEAITGEERAIIATQIARQVNTPLTSSAGRLFDAASALLNVARTVSFEGQAAIDLEMAATRAAARPGGPPYPFSIEETDGPSLIRLGGPFDRDMQRCALRRTSPGNRLPLPPQHRPHDKRGSSRHRIKDGHQDRRTFRRLLPEQAPYAPCRGPPGGCGPRLLHPQASPLQRRRHQPRPGRNRPRAVTPRPAVSDVAAPILRKLSYP